MIRFKVTYRTETHFGFASELIRARGIMHACKLAKNHAQKMRNELGDHSIRVYTIKEYYGAEEMRKNENKRTD